MHFTALVLAGALSLVAAQSSTSNSASSTTSSLSPTQTCLNKCAASDVNCQAQCLGLPYPNGAQTNATTSCEAGCPQGNGTEAETQQYASCLNACVSSYFYASSGTLVSVVSTQPLVNGTTSIVAASATGAQATGSNGASASGSNRASGSATTTASGSAGAASASSSGAAASSSKAAAPQAVAVDLGTSAAGIVGLALAVFAL